MSTRISAYLSFFPSNSLNSAQICLQVSLICLPAPYLPVSLARCICFCICLFLSGYILLAWRRVHVQCHLPNPRICPNFRIHSWKHPQWQRYHPCDNFASLDLVVVIKVLPVLAITVHQIPLNTFPSLSCSAQEQQIWKIVSREILNLSLKVKFCISKNMALFLYVFRTGPCS